MHRPIISCTHFPSAILWQNIVYSVARNLTRFIYSDCVFLSCPRPFHHASIKLLYGVSHFILDKLWQYSPNSINVSDKFHFTRDILNDSFSTETKQTYDSSTRTFLTYFNRWSREKTFDISLSIKLREEFQQWKHHIKRQQILRASDRWIFFPSTIFCL